MLQSVLFDTGCYYRVTISEEAKFLTVSTAFFCDNKQALYGNFEQMLLQLPIHRKTTSLSQKKDITELLHNNRLQAIKYKGHFFTPNPEYSCFPSETVKIPDIRAFLKIISGQKF